MKRRRRSRTDYFLPDDYLDFLAEWAEKTDRFIEVLIPAARPVRTELFHKACRSFVAFACACNIRPPGADCLADPESPEVLAFLRPFLGAVQSVVVDHFNLLLPAYSIEAGTPGQQWLRSWPEFSVRNRLTIAYWIGLDFRKRAALCLRRELKMDSDTVRSLCDCPSPAALDTFVSRAADALRGYYERLERMNSPPCPSLLLETLGDDREVYPWPREKQRLLIATVDWLKRQPF